MEQPVGTHSYRNHHKLIATTYVSNVVPTTQIGAQRRLARCRARVTNRTQLQCRANRSPRTVAQARDTGCTIAVPRPSNAHLHCDARPAPPVWHHRAPLPALLESPSDLRTCQPQVLCYRFTAARFFNAAVYGFPENPCQNWLRIRNRKLVTNS